MYDQCIKVSYCIENLKKDLDLMSIRNQFLIARMKAQEREKHKLWAILDSMGKETQKTIKVISLF